MTCLEAQQLPNEIYFHSNHWIARFAMLICSRRGQANRSGLFGGHVGPCPFLFGSSVFFVVFCFSPFLLLFSFRSVSCTATSLVVLVHSFYLATIHSAVYCTF